MFPLQKVLNTPKSLLGKLPLNLFVIFHDGHEWNRNLGLLFNTKWRSLDNFSIDHFLRQSKHLTRLLFNYFQCVYNNTYAKNKYYYTHINIIIHICSEILCIICIYCIHFLYPFIYSGHLVCFHVLAIVTNAAVNMGVHVSGFFVCLFVCFVLSTLWISPSPLFLLVMVSQQRSDVILIFFLYR